MNKAKSLLFVVCGVLCFLVGCANQQQFEAVERICIPSTGRAEAMQAAEEVLGKMHFAVAKADAERTFIRTRPLPGARFFEFWRSETRGPFNTAEANLHSIRRIAELNITQDDERLCIECNVDIQRLYLPQRQIASSSEAYQMFSASDPSMQRMELHPEQKKGMAWVDLGRDNRLETEILKRIEKRLKGKTEDRHLTSDF